MYRIGPGDALGFRFLEDESLSSEVNVRYDGCISLALIPDVKVGGKTKEEAIEVMSERARREAFAGLYAPLPPDGAAAPTAAPPRRPWKAVAGFVAFLIGAMALLWALLSLLS